MWLKMPSGNAFQIILWILYVELEHTYLGWVLSVNMFVKVSTWVWLWLWPYAVSNVDVVFAYATVTLQWSHGLLVLLRTGRYRPVLKQHPRSVANHCTFQWFFCMVLKRNKILHCTSNWVVSPNVLDMYCLCFQYFHITLWFGTSWFSNFEMRYMKTPLDVPVERIKIKFFQ